jgi:hypothetical protein
VDADRPARVLPAAGASRGRILRPSDQRLHRPAGSVLGDARQLRVAHGGDGPRVRLGGGGRGTPERARVGGRPQQAGVRAAGQAVRPPGAAASALLRRFRPVLGRRTAGMLPAHQRIPAARPGRLHGAGRRHRALCARPPRCTHVEAAHPGHRGGGTATGPARTPRDPPRPRGVRFLREPRVHERGHGVRRTSRVRAASPSRSCSPSMAGCRTWCTRRRAR